MSAINTPIPRPEPQHPEGLVRRFAPGTSGLGFDGFLANRGFVVSISGSMARLYRKGRSGCQRMSLKQLIAFLDDLRVAEGLPPISLKSAALLRKGTM